MIGDVFRILDYASLLKRLMYWISSIEQSGPQRSICYIAKATKGERTPMNGRPIALVEWDRGLFALIEEREAQAFRLPYVQTSVLYDERFGEACTDLKNQRHVHLSERSFVPSRKSCDSCDSSRPFFRVLS